MSLLNQMQKSYYLWTAALFGSIALLVYGFSLWNGFVDYDDTRLILENELIRYMDPLTWKQIFTSYEAVLYTPLLFLSYQIDYALGGLQPFVYHMDSLLLHIGTAVLVSTLMRMLTGERLASLLIGILFLVHPLNTEVVAWASARKDGLAGLFGMAAMIAYVSAKKNESRQLYAVSLLYFLLSLLSKPSMLALPLALPLLDSLQQRNWKKHWQQLLPFFSLSLAFGVIGLFGNTQLARMSTSSPLEPLFLSMKSSGMLLLRTLLPLKLSVMYPFTEPVSIASPHILLPGMLIIGLVIAGWHLRKTQPVILQGLLLFLILLAPTFNSFRYGENFGDVYFTADRYAYVPMIGLLLIMTTFLGKALHQWKRAYVLVPTAIVLCMFAGLAYAQAATWHSTKTLFLNVVEHYPNAQMAYNSLGTLYAEKQLYTLAEESYKKSIAIRPTGTAYANLGQTQMNMGKNQEAIESFSAALTYNPFNAPVQLNIGVAYLQMNKPEEAVAAFLNAAALDPTSTVPWTNIGLVRESMGNIAGAIEAFGHAQQLAPDQENILRKIESLKKKL